MGELAENYFIDGKQLKLVEVDNTPNNSQLLMRKATPGSNVFNTPMVKQSTAISKILETFEHETVFEETENSVDSL